MVKKDFIQGKAERAGTLQPEQKGKGGGCGEGAYLIKVYKSPMRALKKDGARLVSVVSCEAVGTN